MCCQEKTLIRRSIVAGVACLVIALVAQIQPTFAQKKLTAAEAKEHAGETATVCGTVVSAHYAASTKGQPTFLNLDKPYPNPIFTIVIWGSDRGKFGQPEVKYEHKRVCVTGAIKMYRGAPEVVVEEPTQIVIGQ